MKVPDDEQSFRYWVGIHDLRGGTMRELPLSEVAQVHITTKKKEPLRPAERLLRLQDGSQILQARDLDELAVQLRQRYPDGAYERTLNRERDVQAEQRRRAAMNTLITLIAKSVAEKLLGR